MRKTLIRWHRWAGLALGLLWAVQGLTGALLVFHRELERTVLPQPHPGPMAPVDTLVANASRAAGGATIVRLAVADGNRDLIFAYYRDPQHRTRAIVLDAATAQPVAERDMTPLSPFSGSSLEWVDKLHQELLSGRTGETFIGMSGLFLLSAGLLGLWVAWPARGAWKSAFAWNRWRTPEQKLYGGHRALGLVVGGLIMVLALTGAFMALEQPVTQWLAGMNSLDSSHMSMTDEPLTSTVSAQQALDTAQRRFPGTPWVRIFMPTIMAPVYTIRFYQQGEGRTWLGRTAVTVDAAKGNVVQVYDALRAPWNHRLMDDAYPLHNGELLGLPGRILLLFVGLMLPVLYVTGVWRWFRRRKRTRAAERKAVSTPIRAKAVWGVVALLIATASSFKAGAADKVDPAEARRTVELLEQLLPLDTSNPPGDTRAVAHLLKSTFDAAGIPNQIILAPNGKAAHFVARLPGSGTGRPVLLAAHTDVVPVQRDRWSVDPFAAVEKDGYLWGRGTLDNKGAVAAFARAVIRLKQQHVRLRRDVIFLAEADEEQGQYNTSWLAQSHWDLMDAQFVLNEGGSTVLDEKGQVEFVTVSYADKLTVNLKLTASGPSGHSSRPLPVASTANGQLIAALARLQAYEPPIQLSEQVRPYLQVLARQRGGAFETAVTGLLNASTPAEQLEHSREVIALDPGGWGIEGQLRNTVVITMIQSGIKPNVIPGVAEATVNARLLPGTTVDEFIAELTKVIDNPAIHIEITRNQPAGDLVEFYRKRAAIRPSSLDTQLYSAIAHAAHRLWPQATVLPALLVASTDATPWRERDVPVYGIGPFPVSGTAPTGVHGDDERVAIESIGQGGEFVYRLLREVAAGP